MVLMMLICGDGARRPMCSGWIAAAQAAGIESVEVSSALGLLLSVKDATEVEMVKRAAILTNKVCPVSRVPCSVSRTCTGRCPP